MKIEEVKETLRNNWEEQKPVPPSAACYVSDTLIHIHLLLLDLSSDTRAGISRVERAFYSLSSVWPVPATSRSCAMSGDGRGEHCDREVRSVATEKVGGYIEYILL